MAQILHRIWEICSGHGDFVLRRKRIGHRTIRCIFGSGESRRQSFYRKHRNVVLSQSQRFKRSN
jgi:hypothetical protein